MKVIHRLGQVKVVLPSPRTVRLEVPAQVTLIDFNLGRALNGARRQLFA
jgi:hypothetical protein